MVVAATIKAGSPRAQQRAIWRRSAIALVILTMLWTMSWFAAQMLIISSPLDNADAIVVLSGSAAYIERTQRAGALFKEGHSQRIILTNDNQWAGWSTLEQRNLFFYDRSLQELLRSGVPRAAIEILPKPVSSTHDEAVLLQSYAQENHLGSMLIVTSGYHSRRALWVFQRVVGSQGIEVGMDAVPAGIQTPQPSIWFLYPGGWRMIPLEYLKLMYYHARFSFS